ncbi:MAG: PAS domain S-box protein, partial [Acidobacteriota bacterium]
MTTEIRVEAPPPFPGRWPPATALMALACLGLLPTLAGAEARLWIEPILLLPAIAAFYHRAGSLPNEREQAFWLRLAGSLFFTWFACLLALLLALGASPILEPSIDALRLLAYLPIVLALDLRSHRHAEKPPSQLRQLQLTGTFLFALAAVFYWHLAPSWELEQEGLSGLEIAALEAAICLVLAISAARRSSPRWRLLMAVGAAVFALRAAAALVPESLALPALTALALVLWARLRHRRSAGLQLDPPAPRRLRLEVPVALLVGVLPAFHLLSHALDPGAVLPESSHWLALASIAVLAPLTLLEHLLITRRSSFLELERSRAAEETVERSVYLDSLIEHSPLAIVVLDPAHRVQLINPAFEQLFDFRSHEIVGSTLDVLISTNPKRSEASGYTQAVSEGRSVHVTTRRQRRDGTELDVELYGVPLMRGDELIGVFAIYQDVTDRVRAESALRESEERFKRLSDASFEGIVVCAETQIVDCNLQFARMIGLDRQQMVGRDVIEFVAEEDRRLVSARLQEGHDQPFEHLALRGDGSRLLVEVRGKILSRRGGQTLRVAAVRDVTEARRFEEEVRQSQKMEAVGRLAGGIAHDFNNLLTVIKGYAQLLSLQMEEGKLKNLVEEILQASGRASLMTQRLLAFGRKQAVVPQEMELDAAIRGMEKLLRRLIRADIAFDFRLGAGAGQVRADPSQVEQVILNLAINAGDAMPRGGTLRLGTERLEVEESRPAGPMIAAGSYLRLQVGDTGSGMAPATLEQVFEPFFTTKEKGKGTGLGLATVYTIVKEWDGAIDVESELGEGTTFSVYFPRVPETPETDDGAEVHPQLPEGTETVLVVEDEPGVR